MRFSKPNTPRFAIFGSPAMQCNKVTEKFDKMKINGYSESDFIDGPENGWLGYYSLTQQNKTEHLQMSFADYIDENKPVTFIDPAADPYICGHTGHALTSCGIKFSQF